MPLYVTLGKYTQEGIKGISPEQLQQIVSKVEANGGKRVAAYALMGEWDVLALVEYPDEQSAMRALAAIGKLDITTTRTMTALPLEEFVNLAQNA